MRNKRDSVFVIKSINYSEADKIITVFGRERGKFSLIAKGVRKLTSKNRGNIQTLSISDISYYQGQGLPILLESEQIHITDFEDIKSQNAQRVLYILNKILPEEAPNEKIFDSLSIIVQKGVSDEYVNKFRLLFLIQEGLISDLSFCSTCSQQNSSMYIDLLSLNSVCNNCLKHDNLKDRYLKADKELYSNILFTSALDKYIKKVIEEIA